MVRIKNNWEMEVSNLHTPSYTVYSNKVWLDGALSEANIIIEEGKILNVVRGAKTSEAHDYSPQVIMPGVIDAHVHINEPGRADWEGFNTATRAAAKGGITLLVDMPLNSSPVTTNLPAFEAKLKASEGQLHVNCGFWAGATATNLDDLHALLDRGCLGVKVFLSDSGLAEFPNIKPEDLAALMKGLASRKVPVLAHCELDKLPAPEINENQHESYAAYLASRPKNWENKAIELFLGFCEEYNCSAHVVHLSSAEALPFIEQKRAQGLPFTVETCPHYLFFHSEEIPDGSTLHKCAPPIREQANNDELKAAIKIGLINFIASDHSPAPPELKELDSGDFTKAWGGIAGLQFLLPASWTALREWITLEEFIPLLTSKPAEFLQIPNRIGQITAGSPADLCIWDPETAIEVKPEMIEHKHKASPYASSTLYGQVITTIVAGQKVYEDGKFEQLRCGKAILKKNNQGI